MPQVRPFAIDRSRFLRYAARTRADHLTPGRGTAHGAQPRVAHGGAARGPDHAQCGPARPGRPGHGRPGAAEAANTHPAADPAADPDAAANADPRARPPGPRLRLVP